MYNFLNYCFHFLQINTQEELLDHVIIFLIFWGISLQFHIVAAPIYIPLTMHKDSFFSTSLPKAVICHLFDNSSSDSYYLTVVLTCISLVISDVDPPLHVCWISACLWKMFIHIFCPFFLSYLDFFKVELHDFIYFRYIWNISFANTFSHCIGCLFI